jgi:hypothetical protein
MQANQKKNTLPIKNDSLQTSIMARGSRRRQTLGQGLDREVSTSVRVRIHLCLTVAFRRYT